jgi:hypothetical protein
MLDGEDSREFHHLACSGKKCEDVQQTQLPSANADLVTPERLGTVCFRVETILSHTFSHSYGHVCSFIYYLIQLR